MFVFSVLLYLHHFLLLRNNSDLDVYTTAGVGQLVESVGKKVSGTVSGSHGTTSAGPLRQLQLTDCVTLPAAVQRQLYLGEIDVLL